MCHHWTRESVEQRLAEREADDEEPPVDVELDRENDDREPADVPTADD